MQHGRRHRQTTMLFLILDFSVKTRHGLMNLRNWCTGVQLMALRRLLRHSYMFVARTGKFFTQAQIEISPSHSRFAPPFFVPLFFVFVLFFLDLVVETSLPSSQVGACRAARQHRHQGRAASAAALRHYARAQAQQAESGGMASGRVFERGGRRRGRRRRR